MVIPPDEGYKKEEVSSPSMINALREYSHREMPDYMVPAQFLVVESFPLTVNGKVDVSKLNEWFNSDKQQQPTKRPSSLQEKLKKS